MVCPAGVHYPARPRRLPQATVIVRWRDVASQNWQERVDPIAGTGMDLAFVITPEPTTVSMVALVSGLAVFIRRRFLG